MHLSAKVILSLAICAVAAWYFRYESLASPQEASIVQLRRDRWTNNVQFWHPYVAKWMPFQIPNPQAAATPFVPPPLDSIEPLPRATPYFVVPRLIIQGKSQAFAYEDRAGKTITRPLLPGEKIPASIRIP
jgi:hypothetical protein